MQSRRVRREASLYERHFGLPPSREAGGPDVDPRFETAWEAEFGFSVTDLVKLLDAIDQLGLARDSAVFTVDGKTLQDALAQAVGDQRAAAFLNRFALVHRSRWDRTPTGFAAKDWYPWRFSRRLSLVSRPLVRLEQEDSACCVVAPGLVRNGVGNLLAHALDGELPPDSFASDAMRRWIGTRSGEKGRDFNESVASELDSDGWEVRSTLEVPGALNRKLDRDYGDIDVLAWKPGERRILVVEAKDVGMARGEGEIARQLYEFRGRRFGSGERDRLLRHLDRVAVLREYLSELKKNLRLPEGATLIDPWLVFSSSVPLQYIEGLDINVAPLPDLLERLAASR